jgi:uncharacterized membrane protein
VRKTFFARWRSAFLTGLAVTLPAVVSIAALIWLFSTVTNITDVLLFFLPHKVTHRPDDFGHPGLGPVHWYWSVAAFLLAIGLVCAIGVLARYYIGKKVIDWTDRVIMQVPILNKFYGALKQVNEAFSGSKNSFKTVVMVEFPGPGNYSIGFITNEEQGEIQKQSGLKLVSVFIPTTPNPTSGFLILVPVERIVKLDMSVADGIKYIVSLGSIPPEHLTHPR